jgi:hypothetical protein
MFASPREIVSARMKIPRTTMAWPLLWPLAWLHLHAAEPPAPIGGTLDVQFDLHTGPGGPPGPAAAGVATINVHLSAIAAGVAVDDEGKFSFRVQGTYRLDSYSSFGDVSVQNNEQRQATVRGVGVIARDGSITARLEWTHGAGLLVYTVSGASYVAQQPAVAVPHVMDWTLQPAAERIEDLGPDMRRKTTTYKSSRPSTVIGSQAAAMTEQVELKHVQHDRLVPRG